MFSNVCFGSPYNSSYIYIPFAFKTHWSSLEALLRFTAVHKTVLHSRWHLAAFLAYLSYRIIFSQSIQIYVAYDILKKRDFFDSRKIGKTIWTKFVSRYINLRDEVVRERDTTCIWRSLERKRWRGGSDSSWRLENGCATRFTRKCYEFRSWDPMRLLLYLQALASPR